MLTTGSSPVGSPHKGEAPVVRKVITRLGKARFERIEVEDSYNSFVQAAVDSFVRAKLGLEPFEIERTEDDRD